MMLRGRAITAPLHRWGCRVLSTNELPDLKLDSVLARAGCKHDAVTGAITPPLHLSTTFHRDGDGEYRDRYQYSRIDGPTRNLFEEALESIECPASIGEGEGKAVAFGSGMAAISALLQTLKPGDHLLLSDDVYMVTRVVIDKVFRDWGLNCTEVDMTDSVALENALREHQPSMVWVETPTNPTMKVVDIRKVSNIVEKHAETSDTGVKPMIAVDATFNSPYLLRPLALGADFVVHSVTKYIGGHSDMQAGVVVGRDGPLMERVREMQVFVGGVAAPL
jgi:cystathionine beta-lyase/cystathionine gamma-synthase